MGRYADNGKSLQAGDRVRRKETCIRHPDWPEPGALYIVAAVLEDYGTMITLEGFEGRWDSSNFEFVGSAAEVEGDDPVEHPSHYCRGGFEALDIIEAWELNYHRGNALKYICRAGHKDPAKEAEDLKKAILYLQRDVALLEGGDQ